MHWARDAAEACAIVAEIAQAHGVDEVVKVKSMATQEIELNEALAAEGIAAWETDLAELIVQLGDDLPSHILVPAIHRNRAEIRDIFRARMAAPGGRAGRPDRRARRSWPRPPGCTCGRSSCAPRSPSPVRTSRSPRPGTLVVVESEGNGRMCLTLPEVLVSVVGIEKVVPTWADLDVFLQLLPRSSTGERMNPYTSTWSGVTPGDGPQEVHVVLLDNGRTRALADEVGRQALRCIRCSACLNVCPVYERTGGHAYGSVYPGPIGAILNPLLKGVGTDAQIDSLPYASSLCGACFEVCPVAHRHPVGAGRPARPGRRRPPRRRPVPKAEAVAMKGAAAGRSGSGRRLGRLAERFARPRQPGGRVAAAAGARSRWTGARDLPLPPRESFRAWWRRTGRGPR